jgi:prevent-host-death family protein
MKTVGAYEAKTHLPKLLERVAGGEKITITKHGVPVATLQPADISKKKPVHETIEQLRQFRRRHSLGKLSLKKMIDEGRA